MNLIRGRYPVNTEVQVKTAAEYFATHITAFTPSERMLIASRLEKRANELNTFVDKDWVKTYSRPLKKEAACSPDSDNNLKAKKSDAKRLGAEKVKIGNKEKDYGEMVDKIASDNTDLFSKVQALIELDKLAGLDASYDHAGGTMDPVAALCSCRYNNEYDSVKIAGDLTDYDLRRMASNDLEKVASVMGEDFSDNFAKDPCKAVYSLDVGNKELFLNLVR